MILTNYGMAPFDSVELKKHATAQDPWSHIHANTVNPRASDPIASSAGSRTTSSS